MPRSEGNFVSDNESSRMRSDSFFIIRQFIPSSLHARLKCPVEVNRGIRVLNIGDHRGTLVTSREEGGGREGGREGGTEQLVAFESTAD